MISHLTSGSQYTNDKVLKSLWATHFYMGSRIYNGLCNYTKVLMDSTAVQIQHGSHRNSGCHTTCVVPRDISAKQSCQGSHKCYGFTVIL